MIMKPDFDRSGVADESGCHSGLILFLLTICFLLFPAAAWAQKYPLDLSYSRIEASPLLDDEERSIGMTAQHALLAIPILPFESFRLVTILKQDQLSFDYQGFPQTVFLADDSQPYNLEDFPEKLTLSEISLALLLNFGDSKWMIRRGHNTATDGKDDEDDDHADSAQLIYISKTSDINLWLMGVTWSGGMDDDGWAPLLGYVHKGDNFVFRTLLPTYIILKYKPTNHLYFLWDTSRKGDTFRLTSDAPWENAIMKFVQFTSRLEMGYHTSSGLEFGLSYGSTFNRTWEIKNEDLEPIGNLDMKPQAVWSLNIHWVPPK